MHQDSGYAAQQYYQGCCIVVLLCWWATEKSPCLHRFVPGGASRVFADAGCGFQTFRTGSCHCQVLVTGSMTGSGRLHWPLAGMAAGVFQAPVLSSQTASINQCQHPEMRKIDDG